MVALSAHLVVGGPGLVYTSADGGGCGWPEGFEAECLTGVAHDKLLSEAQAYLLASGIGHSTLQLELPTGDAARLAQCRRCYDH